MIGDLLQGLPQRHHLEQRHQAAKATTCVLLGQVEPTKIDVDELQQRLERPDHRDVAASLAEVKFDSAMDLLSTYAGQGPDLQDWLRDAQINTDRNLRLQYLAGMGLNTQQGTQILNGITRYYSFPDEVFVGSGEKVQALNTDDAYRLMLRPIGGVGLVTMEFISSEAVSRGNARQLRKMPFPRRSVRSRSRSTAPTRSAWRPRRTSSKNWLPTSATSTWAAPPTRS